MLAALLALALLLAACAQKNIENKEAVRQAVIEYLASRQAQTGLDMSTMDVNVTAMTFERDTARATVEFRVKNSDAGMQLNYTLDRKGDKWVVQPRQDGGQGHGVVQPPDRRRHRRLARRYGPAPSRSSVYPRDAVADSDTAPAESRNNEDGRRSRRRPGRGIGGGAAGARGSEHHRVR